MIRKAIWMLLAGASLLPAETRVFQGFTLIDGTGKAPLADAAMVITDGRITYAGPKKGMKMPAGKPEVFELAGKYIIPGLINLHCHLGNTKRMAQDPKNFTRENVNDQLKTYARNGVTAVLSMGADQPLVFGAPATNTAAWVSGSLFKNRYGNLGPSVGSGLRNFTAGISMSRNRLLLRSSGVCLMSGISRKSALAGKQRTYMAINRVN